MEQREVSPAITVFENRLGGRVAVCAHVLTPLMTVYAFMSDTRKEQLIHLLGWLGRRPLPAVTHTGIDTYLLFGFDEEKKEHVAAIFNLSHDEVECPEVQFNALQPKEVKMLTEDGQWKNLSFENRGERVRFDVRLETMKPLVLRIR